MRFFKSSALLAVLISGQFAVASQEPAENVTESTRPSINIRANDFSVSLNSVGVGYGSAQKFFMMMGPQVEYFVMDRLGLGLQTVASTDFSSNGTYLALGPAATYHFWNSKSLSAYTGASFMFNNLTRRYDANISRTLFLQVGVNYNFSPWFGVGPRLSYSTHFSEQYSDSLALNAVNLYFYF